MGVCFLFTYVIGSFLLKLVSLKIENSKQRGGGGQMKGRVADRDSY